MTKKTPPTVQEPEEKTQAQIAAQQEKRQRLEDKVNSEYSDRRGGTFVVVDGVRTHELDVSEGRRAEFGLGPKPTPPPDGEVVTDE